MQAHRKERVISLIKREIALFLNKTPTNQEIISVLDIEITADFKDAKVYLSVFPQEKAEDVLKKIEQETDALQHELGRKLKMKFTPRLRFFIDNYQEKLDKVERKLKEINHDS